MSTRLQNKTVAQVRKLAREDAQAVLEKYWTPILLPVDHVRIARSLGASVFKAELGDDTWGMLVGTSSGLDIYLDRDQPPTRYRFSCAHEIGHIVSRGEDIVAGKAIIERRSDAERGRADEVYANEFAGSLLMPDKEFRKAAATCEDNLELADLFDVSLAAAKYRRSLLKEEG